MCPHCTGALLELASTRLNTQPFFFFPVFACSPGSSSESMFCSTRGRSRPSRGAQLQISSGGTSAAVVSVQESQHPPLVTMSSQQRHHMCRQLQHQAGNAGICSQPSSPSPAFPSPPSPIGRHGAPRRGGDCKVKWLPSRSSMSPDVFTVMVEGKKKITEAPFNTCRTVR